MTMTFERFLRSFSDEELTRFATERAAVRPPYWRVMRLALQVERARRGLAVDPGLSCHAVSTEPEPLFRDRAGLLAIGPPTTLPEDDPRMDLGRFADMCHRR